MVCTWFKCLESQKPLRQLVGLMVQTCYSKQLCQLQDLHLVLHGCQKIFTLNQDRCLHKATDFVLIEDTLSYIELLFYKNCLHLKFFHPHTWASKRMRCVCAQGKAAPSVSDTSINCDATNVGRLVSILNFQRQPMYGMIIDIVYTSKWHFVLTLVSYCWWLGLCDSAMKSCRPLAGIPLALL